MTKAEALALQGELVKMVQYGPGKHEPSLERVRVIEFQFRAAGETTPYIREKVVEALGDLRDWLSDRKWQRAGTAPARHQSMLAVSLTGLGRAIESEWRERGGGDD